ncbi:MAG: exo-alpha-sialidase [Planctomycetes bacterium]|nr:exo-alpha-sialidase [Planctomycetota bacterium]
MIPRQCVSTMLRAACAVVAIMAGGAAVAMPPAVTGSAAEANAGESRAAHRRTPRDLRPLRHEALDQPQLPPATVETAAGVRTGPVVRDRFISRQVNVNASGNNIVGDAANEPSIAVDPTDPDIIVIGWRQFDTIASNFRQAGRAYSHDRGLTWTFPGVLTPGVFRSDPVLEADASGVLYYNSLKSNFLCDIFKSFDGGVTWQGPIAAYGGDKQWMAIDRTGGMGHGHLYQAWSIAAGCCGNSVFNRSINAGATWSVPIEPPETPHWGTVTVGPDGHMFLVGTSGLTGEVVLVRSSNAQNPAVNPTFDLISNVNIGGYQNAFATGPNPAGLLGQLWVAADHSNGPRRGDVYVVGSLEPVAGGDPLDVMFTRSEDNGQTWSAPVRINDDATGNGAWQWFATMDVAPNGRIDVVWNDTRNFPGSDNLSELYYSFSTDGGATWSTNVPMSPMFDSFLGWPQQQKLGDYYDMVSDDVGASLAYAATFNGEQDVYFLRIGMDCNANNVNDETDIDLGTSLDANGNRIPDECELAPPAAAPAPHNRPKNRYISFTPANGATAVAFTVDRVLPTAASAGWVGVPDANGMTAVVAAPVTRVWSEPVVHVGDCAIAPVSTYEIRATADAGTTFSTPLEVSTIAQPAPKFWGDTVGQFGIDTPNTWDPPNGVVNVNDFVAALEKFQNPATTRVHLTVVDVVGAGLPGFEACLNRTASIADVFNVIKAFQGEAYPFTTSPAACPVCP